VLRSPHDNAPALATTRPTRAKCQKKEGWGLGKGVHLPSPVLPFARRALLAGFGAAALVRPALAWSWTGLAERFRRIEAEAGGRLGVAVLDTQTGAIAGHRADERFPICSTFKAPLAAAVLARVDAGRDRLDRRVSYTAADLVAYSPVTERHAGAGMTLAELCDAVVTLSDNGAANLLLRLLGGPPALTAWLRSIGDTVTRLDRDEPALNEALPGDERDTSTPAAMLGSLRAVTLGEALSPASRALFTGWLVDCRTGGQRLRAGLPAAWRVGDKTGTGERGTYNDIGLAWPPGRAPLFIAAYLTGNPGPAERANGALAAVARAVAEAVAG